MDERVRFVGRLLDGEKMVALCREFAISRKTGYKIFDRYKEYGLEALTDRSRRPWRYANQLPQQVEAAILNLKREKPYWGARKIRERLLRRFSCEVKVPARRLKHWRAAGVFAGRRRFASIWSRRDSGWRRWAIPGTTRVLRRQTAPRDQALESALESCELRVRAKAKRDGEHHHPQRGAA